MRSKMGKNCLDLRKNLYNASSRLQLQSVFIVYLMIWWCYKLIFLCISFNPPLNTVSIITHLEEGHKLSSILTEDVTVLGQLAASDAEAGQSLFQIHLHPHLCPSLRCNTCFFTCPFLAVGGGGAIVYVTSLTTIAHCIAWLPRRPLLFLSDSVDYSDNYLPKSGVGDAGT